MTTARRVMQGPARWLLPLCGLVVLAGGLIAASAGGWLHRGSPQASATLTPADPGADMPVPKQHSSSSFSTTRVTGIEIPLRVGLEAHVQAPLGAVLAFYRTELPKRGWEEKPDGTVVAADHAQLAFVSPKGPATLKLGRAKGETIVDLVQRNTEAVAKANFLPMPGQARLIFGYLAPDVASLAINGQTIKNGDDLVNIITAKHPGSTVQVGYLRSGVKNTVTCGIANRNQTVNAMTGQGNGPSQNGPSQQQTGPDKLGITAVALPQTFGGKGLHGVLVQGIKPGSFADEIGLQPGVVITEVNKTAVNSVTDYNNAVSSLKSGQDIVLSVVTNPRNPNGNFYVGGTLP